MLDLASYREKTAWTVKKYAEHGIYPGERLLLTSDHKGETDLLYIFSLMELFLRCKAPDLNFKA